MKLKTASFILMSIGLYGLILADYFWIVKNQSRLVLLTIFYLLFIIIQSVMFFMKDILLKKWSNDKLSAVIILAGTFFLAFASIYQTNEDTRTKVGFFFIVYIVGYWAFMLHQYKLLYNQEKKNKTKKSSE